MARSQSDALGQWAVQSPRASSASHSSGGIAGETFTLLARARTFGCIRPSCCTHAPEPQVRTHARTPAAEPRAKSYRKLHATGNGLQRTIYVHHSAALFTRLLLASIDWLQSAPCPARTHLGGLALVGSMDGHCSLLAASVLPFGTLVADADSFFCMDLVLTVTAHRLQYAI